MFGSPTARQACDHCCSHAECGDNKTPLLRKVTPNKRTTITLVGSPIDLWLILLLEWAIKVRKQLPYLVLKIEAQLSESLLS